MNKLFHKFKYVFLSALVLSFPFGQIAFSQHEGHDMAGMNMSKASPKKTALTKHTKNKRKVHRKRRRVVTKHQMGNMPGMNMAGMNMPAAPAARPRATPHTHMPGMSMPEMSMPAAAPAATPSATPHTHMPGMNMPEMNMPSPSASPPRSPEKMDMNMQMPAASPPPAGGHTHVTEPAAMGNMNMETSNKTQPAGDSMKGMDMSGTGTASMSMGPLLVMSSNDMGIRVGSSERNVVSMGAMGSGTTWQPSSAPMHMCYKQSGDWLLMFHYNVPAWESRTIIRVSASGPTPLAALAISLRVKS